MVVVLVLVKEEETIEPPDIVSVDIVIFPVDWFIVIPCPAISEVTPPPGAYEALTAFCTVPSTLAPAT